MLDWRGRLRVFSRLVRGFFHVGRVNETDGKNHGLTEREEFDGVLRKKWDEDNVGGRIFEVIGNKRVWEEGCHFKRNGKDFFKVEEAAIKKKKKKKRKSGLLLLWFFIIIGLLLIFFFYQRAVVDFFLSSLGYRFGIREWGFYRDRRAIRGYQKEHFFYNMRGVIWRDRKEEFLRAWEIRLFEGISREFSKRRETTFKHTDGTIWITTHPSAHPWKCIGWWIKKKSVISHQPTHHCSQAPLEKWK